ncbi:hypothetical protein ABMA77_03615 [Halobacteriovorax sp. RZ-1]|uniref:hypothetical protein n=1 Tax=unclassified Halobacteriovorax TaxID=2639665 RepID=UPI00371E312D
MKKMLLATMLLMSTSAFAGTNDVARTSYKPLKNVVPTGKAFTFERNITLKAGTSSKVIAGDNSTFCRLHYTKNDKTDRVISTGSKLNIHKVSQQLNEVFKDTMTSTMVISFNILEYSVKIDLSKSGKTYLNCFKNREENSVAGFHEVRSDAEAFTNDELRDLLLDTVVVPRFEKVVIKPVAFEAD